MARFLTISDEFEYEKRISKKNIFFNKTSTV